MRKIWFLLLLPVLLGCSREPVYDLAILHGHVLDPESGLDQVAHIGIQDGEIKAVRSEPVQGTTILDATGMMVAPGFIDLHSHGQDEENYRYKAMDGVTTALELEVGVAEVARWYEAREGKSLVHYGATAGHIPVRMSVMNDPGTFLPSGDAVRRPATASEQKQILGRLREGLEQGAVGIGFGLQYTPAAGRDEVLEAFRLAAEFGAACYVHLRYMGTLKTASSVAALEEVLSLAEETGAPLHVVHVQSSGLRATPELLRKIEEARGRGLDVTTECYPYPAAMTRLDSAIFNPGWQEVLGIGYGQLQWAATGERLSAESFRRYRQEGGMVVIFMIPEEVVDLAVSHPLTMIASDGILEDGKGHPRAAGTFSRVLGRYVREQGKLTWMEAVEKMTIEPARRLEGRVPAMKRKGRIREGADADITIFDPETVLDQATYENPAQYSEGIRHVLVHGTQVVRNGKLEPGVLPGRAVRAVAR